MCPNLQARSSPWCWCDLFMGPCQNVPKKNNQRKSCLHQTQVREHYAPCEQWLSKQTWLQKLSVALPCANLCLGLDQQRTLCCKHMPPKYVSTCTYTITYIQSHRYTYIYMLLDIHILHTYIHTYIHTCIHTYTCIHIHTCVHIHTYHIYIYMRMYIYIYIYIYIYTHTHM